MASLDPASIFNAASQSAREALRSSRRVRLAFAVVDGELWTVTSPDIDWLFITAHSKQAAQLMALTAVIRVATWCGADVTIEPR